jgi:hypothetical protein
MISLVISSVTFVIICAQCTVNCNIGDQFYMEARCLNILPIN